MTHVLLPPDRARPKIGGFGVAMTAVPVAAMIEDQAKVAIEATAVVPD